MVTTRGQSSGQHSSPTRTRVSTDGAVTSTTHLGRRGTTRSTRWTSSSYAPTSTEALLASPTKATRTPGTAAKSLEQAPVFFDTGATHFLKRLWYNRAMKKNNTISKKKTNIGLIISYALHAISFMIVAILIYNVHTLYNQTDSLNRQLLQFNGRTNNLEGCWKNQDYECPENKYFDASQFTKDEK